MSSHSLPVALLLGALSIGNVWSTARAVEQDGAAWYRRTRVIDLNRDGVADSAVLVARGSRSDSLSISLLLFVKGREVLREDWDSSYELIDPPDSVKVPTARDSFLRNRFDGVLAEMAVEPVDTATARIVGDSANVEAVLREGPKYQVSFSYGYESTVAVVWFAAEQRFRLLWSCC